MGTLAVALHAFPYQHPSLDFRKALQFKLVPLAIFGANWYIKSKRNVGIGLAPTLPLVPSRLRLQCHRIDSLREALAHLKTPTMGEQGSYPVLF